MKKLLLSALTLFTSIFVYGQTNLSQSITACYAMDGNGIEAFNNLNATLNSITPTTDRFNNPSKAVQFNGSSSSYIELPNSPFLKPSKAISISCWVKTSQLTDQYVIMTRNPALNDFEAYDLHLANVSGVLRMRAKKCDGLSNALFITGATNLNLNTWNHFVLTIDTLNMKLYTNGTLDASIATPYNFNYEPTKGVIIGGSNETNFNLPFTGSFDNLLIYKRVLTQAEITQLYTNDPSCSTLTNIETNTNEENNISIYPNPSNGKITITGEDHKNIEIYNLLGEKISNYTFEVIGESNFTINGLKSGTYFLRGIAPNKNWNKKVIITE